VLSVDGQEVARKPMENSNPVTFPEDDIFDIGEGGAEDGREVAATSSKISARKDRKPTR
jgi:hypothetical protein